MTPVYALVKLKNGLLEAAFILRENSDKISTVKKTARYEPQVNQTKKSKGIFEIKVVSFSENIASIAIIIAARFAKTGGYIVKKILNLSIS